MYAFVERWVPWDEIEPSSALWRYSTSVVIASWKGVFATLGE